MPDFKISALPLATSPLASTDEIEINQGGVSKRVPILELGMFHTRALAADQSNSTVTPTKVTGLDEATGTGTYVFQYFIRYQAAALTTGVRFDVNYSGTVTAFVWNQRFVDVSATAATAAPSQNNVQAASAVMGAFSSRAKGTAGRGTTISVDTINADMLMVIEGLMVVTAAGNLELYHGSEVAAASTVKAGSSVIVQRTG